ncbi:hypothetical protein HK405_015666 [Cladochytrium tenue]|nr:hypothetical protein HK405_015666 [Cladochytrium tenue]
MVRNCHGLGWAAAIVLVVGATFGICGIFFWCMDDQSQDNNNHTAGTYVEPRNAIQSIPSATTTGSPSKKSTISEVATQKYLTAAQSSCGVEETRTGHGCPDPSAIPSEVSAAEEYEKIEIEARRVTALRTLRGLGGGRDGLRSGARGWNATSALDGFEALVAAAGVAILLASFENAGGGGGGGGSVGCLIGTRDLAEFETAEPGESVRDCDNASEKPAGVLRADGGDWELQASIRTGETMSTSGGAGGGGGMLSTSTRASFAEGS